MILLADIITRSSDLVYDYGHRRDRLADSDMIRVGAFLRICVR